MPVKIIHHESRTQPVSSELIVDTIETNRERVRTVGNMIITLSGILIPACLAFLLFFMDKGTIQKDITIFLIMAVLLFLVSSFLSIVSSFLRNNFLVSDEAQFIESLLLLLKSELRLSYLSFAFLVAGIVAMITSVLIYILRNWR